VFFEVKEGKNDRREGSSGRGGTPKDPWGTVRIREGFAEKCMRFAESLYERRNEPIVGSDLKMMMIADEHNRSRICPASDSEGAFC
jgi:hypothetical protein